MSSDGINFNLSVSSNILEQPPMASPGVRESSTVDILITSLKAILGTVAAIQNFTIFVLLLMKKKRVVSELLVISNALLDTIMAIIFLIKSTMVKLLIQLPLIGQCIFQYFLYTFLTTASFFLIISISINRYVAVRHCHDYNTIFSKSRVRALLATIVLLSFLHSVGEIVVCKGMWPWYEDYWLFSRVFLVLLCCAVLLGVYSAISDQFSQPFWAPMLKPVHFYRKHVSCNRKENSKGKTQKGNHTEHNKCHLAMKTSTEPLLISRKCEETHDIRITLCPITNGAEHPTESCYPIEIHYDATLTNYATLKDCARPTDYAMSPDYVRQKVKVVDQIQAAEEEHDGISIGPSHFGLDADPDNDLDPDYDMDIDVDAISFGGCSPRGSRVDERGVKHETDSQKMTITHFF
ncbi:uncharacterized protein LOC134855306 isoform X2 [Symsagittifera roscoffensis]|uniref:uncharacterized protein LOC134855306 isoform X2 n=1 Tax=Symsagittifera roscoffensis TaxID=84072 RepID=UPI00307B337A